MGTLPQTTTAIVKLTSKEIIWPPFKPRPIPRLLNIGTTKTRILQSSDASKPTNPIPQPITTSIAPPPLPPSENTVEPLAIETFNVRALVADLLTLTSALRPLVQVLQEPAAPASPIKPKRKYTPRKTDQTVVAVPIKDRKWITVKQAAAVYPKSEQAFRHLVHQASQYQKYPKANLPSNGFEKCVVRQQGSRNVYLNADELERWMTQSQGGVQ